MKLILKFAPTALLALVIMGSVALVGSINPDQAQAADVLPAAIEKASPGAQGGFCSCSVDTLNCQNFSNREEAQACFDQCLLATGFDVHDLDRDSDGVACETVAYTLDPALQPDVPESQRAILPEVVPGANNQIYNGNFEFGFYQVPQLGFEVGDVGNVPFYWGWYKSNTYAKVNIYNNQGFGIVCADDQGAAQAFNTARQELDPAEGIFGPIPGVNPYVKPNNSLSLHMQSTDQQDMRLGVYQTVNVIPGRDYRFSMSGTIQVQKGAKTLQTVELDDPLEAQNHTVEVSFDESGGTNWEAIPLEKRHVVQFKEEELEFVTTTQDEDIATIQSFETVVRARSDKLTVFITGWRKWANWRSAIFTLDCIALTPLGAGGATAAVQSVPASPPDLTNVQEAAVVKPSATETESTGQPTEVQIIPPSGGIVEKASNSMLVVGLSVIVLGGLVGAGIWNIRRR